MAGLPIEIHVDPLAKPTACHTPFPIPLHWQQKVHDNLIRDEPMGILEKVPHGEPTECSHCMVITRKHDESPRRTVDLSPLNRFCKRETHAFEAPFHLTRRVPRNTWKTVTDAWNGTIATHYVYLIATLLHSLHHSENGDTPEHLKVFFLPEMATIVASALFKQILSVKNAVSMTQFSMMIHFNSIGDEPLNF